MKPLKAGDLRTPIVIQSKTVTYNSLNEPIAAWATLLSPWAAKMDDAGRETRAAQRIVAETEIVLRIRYDSRVTTLNRVVYAGRTFEILHVDDEEFRHISLLLSCKEVV
jgi:SPP1 family predicted phage head-tail adaptor